jgi:Carboxypeptidase regulatory-like domain
MRRFPAPAFLFFLLLGVARVGYAQNSASGDIRGTVTDATGSVLAGAHVSVTNLDTGVVENFTTNQDGLYDTVSSRPGKYQISFDTPGFATTLRGPINLSVGVITINAKLTVGKVDEVVNVSSDASLLKTETAEQSTTLDAKTMSQLPQAGPNGADWQNFVVLLPGTAGAPSAGSVSNPGAGVSVNGNLPYNSNILADGASVTLPQSSNFDSSTFETVSEVVIDTSTFSAEYGIGGAVMNQITKGGTNDWHGAAYEYFQNNALNARSYFNAPDVPLPELRFNQFGGSLGGPILKDKLFFYFNFDKTIDNGTNTGYVTIPTLAERNGDFSAELGGPVLDSNGNPAFNPCDGTPLLQNEIFDQSTLRTVSGTPCRTAFKNNVITSGMSSVAQALQAYYPAPNRPGLQNNYFFTSPAPNPSIRLFGRMDYDLSPMNRITAAVTERDNKANYINEFPCPIDCQDDDVTDYAVQASDTWSVSSTLVNEFRFGFNRQANYFVPDTLGMNIPQKVGLQYSEANILPYINISGGVGGCCDALNPNSNYINVGNSFEPSDVVTMIRGKHILHFGGELLSYQENSTPYGNVESGQFSFTGAYSQATPGAPGTGFGYADFLLGNVQSWNANNQPITGARQKSPQFFIQDDYKLRPNLTLNVGLRYQIQGGWSEIEGREGAFDPTIYNTASDTMGAMWFAGANNRSQLQHTVHDVFLPRVGFAWSPDSNTVLRGGYGLYAYGWSADTYGSGIGFGSNDYGSATDQTNGLTPVVNLSGSGSNLPYLKASTSPTAYNGQGVNYTPYHTPVATIEQWSLSLQHQFPYGVQSEVAYVASHGEHLSFPRDLNQIPENELSVNDSPSGRPYPQFQSISGDSYNGISNYNSFQASAQKRLASSWSFSANYTFAHFLNDMDSSGWGGHGGTQAYQNSYDARANYGRSNFDIRHALKVSVVYELPFGVGREFLNKNVVADAVVGGWQLSIIGMAQSGNPFTVTYGGNNNGDYAQAGSWRPNLVGDPNVAHRTIAGWFNPAAYAMPTAGTFGDNGRNTLTGPGLSELNASLGKTFSVTERIKLQVRADANNVLNHASFGTPDTNFDDPVDTTSTPGRPTGAGTISTTTVNGRNMQLSARLSF